MGVSINLSPRNIRGCSPWSKTNHISTAKRGVSSDRLLESLSVEAVQSSARIQIGRGSVNYPLSLLLELQGSAHALSRKSVPPALNLLLIWALSTI